MTTSFALRTYADTQTASAAAKYAPGLIPTFSPSPGETDPRVRCLAPTCGRLVQPESLVDVTGLPAALRTACGWTGVSYVCDACQHIARLRGVLTHSDMARAQQAPQDVLTRIAAIDAAQAAYRFGKPGQQR